MQPFRVPLRQIQYEKVQRHPGLDLINRFPGVGDDLKPPTIWLLHRPKGTKHRGVAANDEQARSFHCVVYHRLPPGLSARERGIGVSMVLSGAEWFKRSRQRLQPI